MEGEATPHEGENVNTDSPTKTGDNRNPDGTFAPGNSGNPNGRPKTFSITALIKQKLDEIPLGQRKSYGEFIVDSIIDKAVVSGDVGMLKEIWAYIDGKPKQPMEIDVNKESLKTMTDFLQAVGTKHDDKPTETEA